MSEAIDLTKSIVIVTGAARGLGRTMTLGLLTGGARVGAVDLPESRDLVADLLSEAAARSMQDRLLAAYGSVTDEKDCARVVQEIAETCESNASSTYRVWLTSKPLVVARPRSPVAAE